MNQGVIKSFKVKYHKTMVQKNMDYQKFSEKQCPARSFGFKSNANVGFRLRCSIHRNYCKFFS